MASFEPIAIIGQSCILPDALNAFDFWQNTINKQSSIRRCKFSDWGIDPQDLLNEGISNEFIQTALLKSGQVTNIDHLLQYDEFDATQFSLTSLDIHTKWSLYTSLTALHDAGYRVADMFNISAGAVLGNLSYPTRSFNDYVTHVWLQQQGTKVFSQDTLQRIKQQSPTASSRFMSGLPAVLLGQALNLSLGGFAIDAACASAIYAIKLACDYLQDRRANLMLAGAVNGSDELLINMGFNALNALSPSGFCKPFQQDSDGLVPGQGAGFVVLKRLSDALADNNRIYAVIRGIGLSNDGSNKGFLSPSSQGQIAAMKKAYEVANLRPQDISFVECHATGTLVGDRIELASMQKIFNDHPLDLCALKSNIGHLITASGIAALIHVLISMAQATKPPSLFTKKPHEVLTQTNFQLLEEAKSWQHESVKRAAINCFGFGGNNAHMIVEHAPQYSSNTSFFYQTKEVDPIVITGIGIIAAKCQNTQQFIDAFLNGKSQLSKHNEQDWGIADALNILLHEIKFPPASLVNTLAQQLFMLSAVSQALGDAKNIDAKQTSVLIAMQCDPEIARLTFRWRLRELLRSYPVKAELQNQYCEFTLRKICEHINKPLNYAGALGCMPNLVANRINYQYNCQAESYVISGEEMVGVKTLEIAMRQLQNHEIDHAVVGGVDMSCQLAHIQAMQSLYPNQQYHPGDAAAALLLERKSEALKNGKKYFAELDIKNGDISSPDDPLSLRVNPVNASLDNLFGYANNAVTFLHVAAAAIACATAGLPKSNQQTLTRWQTQNRRATVIVNDIKQQSKSIEIKK